MIIPALLICLVSGCSKSNSNTAPAGSSSAPSSTASKAGEGPSAKPGDAVLAVQWTPGDRLLYRMDFEQKGTTKIPQLPAPMEQNVSMGLTYAINVTKETGDGGHELEVEFVAQELDIAVAGQVTSFDSKDKSKNDPNNQTMAPFRKMIGTKLRYLMDAAGKVQKVLNLEEWRTQMEQGIPEQSRSMFEQIYHDGCVRQVADLGFGLPGKATAVGANWPVKVEIPAGAIGKIKLDLQSFLRGYDQHDGAKCAVMDSAGTMTSTGGDASGPMGNMKVEKGKVAGTSWLDVAKGRIVENVSHQSMRIVGPLPGGNGGTFTSDLNQKMTLKLVESGRIKI